MQLQHTWKYSEKIKQTDEVCQNHVRDAFILEHTSAVVLQNR